MEAKERVLAPCYCCRGTGRLELLGEYRSTYLLLAAHGEMNGATVAEVLNISNEAACNRLAELERNGLLTSRRVGRKRLFRLAPAGG